MEIDYIQGGAGEEMFYTDGEAIKVWLDPSLATRPDILQWLTSHEAAISTDHADPDTRIIILHPSSIAIFDRYCHPAWLPARQRMAYRRMLRGGGVEEWRRKVVLTEMWPKLCRLAGRFLGKEDDWGGCRKGGPPKKFKQVPPLPPIEPVTAIEEVVDTPTEYIDVFVDYISKTPQAEQTGLVIDGLSYDNAERDPITVDSPIPEMQDYTVDLITTIDDTLPELPPQTTRPYIQENESPADAVSDAPPEIEITPLPADPSRPLSPIYHTSYEPAQRPFDEDYDLETTQEAGGDGLSSPMAEHISRPIDEDYDEGGPTAWTRNSGVIDARGRLLENVSETPAMDQALPIRRHDVRSDMDLEEGEVQEATGPSHIPIQLSSRATIVDDEGSQTGSGSSGTHRNVLPNPYIPANRSRLQPLDIQPVNLRSISTVNAPIRSSTISHQLAANLSVLLLPQDVALTKNTQTSRWQTPQSPPFILDGIRIFCEGGRFGRKHTASNVVKSGGIVVQNCTDATHALLMCVTAEDGPSRMKYISIATKKNVWCLSYDWLEDSWAAGKLLPEWDYVYEGGVPLNRRRNLPPRPAQPTTPSVQPGNLSTAQRMSQPQNVSFKSTEELKRLFATAMEEHDRTGMTWVQTAADILQKHGTYSLAHWLNLLTDYRNKTGRFVSNRKEPRLSLKDLDQIFTEAHPISQEGSFADVTRHLVATGAWEGLYRDWRSSTGRFANLQSGPSVPRQERLLREYDEYSALFQPYRQMWKAGAGREEIYRKIAKENPEYKYSLSQWGTYFGNWLRGRSIKTNEELPNTQDQISSPSPDRTRTNLSTADLAKLFKAEYDNDTLTAPQVAASAAKKCTYAPGTLANYYNEWRKGSGRFRGIVWSLAYSGTLEKSASIQGSPSTTKRSLEAMSSRSSPTKKVKNSYTDAEEAKMAVYITSRLPVPTEPRSADWEIFAKENPARTHAAWVEHYRQYRARINDLVTKLGGHIPGKRTPNVKRKREGSDDSIVFVAHQDKKQRIEDVEVVNLVDSDEE